MASSAFAKSVKRSKRKFEESKKVKPGGFSLPKLDGTYTATVKAETREVKKKDGEVIPVVKFPFEITEGDDKGKKYFKEIWLNSEDDEKEQRAWNELSKTIQVLCDVDIDEIEIEELEDIFAEITEDEPLCKVACVPWPAGSLSLIHI